MYWDMNGPLKSEKDYRAEALKVSLLDIGKPEDFKRVQDFAQHIQKQ